MPLSAKLLAWIERRHEGEEFVAAFVGGGSPERSPATHVCSTPDKAREWVETLADALGVSVEWVPDR